MDFNAFTKLVSGIPGVSAKEVTTQVWEITSSRGKIVYYRSRGKASVHESDGPGPEFRTNVGELVELAKSKLAVSGEGQADEVMPDESDVPDCLGVDEDE